MSAGIGRFCVVATGVPGDIRGDILRFPQCISSISISTLIHCINKTWLISNKKLNSMTRTLAHLANNAYFLPNDPCLTGLRSAWKQLIKGCNISDCTILQRIMGRLRYLLLDRPVCTHIHSSCHRNPPLYLLLILLCCPLWITQET